MAIELKDLVGEHLLDGVDFEEVRVAQYSGFQDANSCRFRLNGVIYTAIEDPDDGYRSTMRELRVGGDTPMKNVFPPVAVRGVLKKREQYDDGESDILILTDIETGKEVLEVGTSNSDDYYPSFVANFQPENMTTNATLAPVDEPEPMPSTAPKKRHADWGIFSWMILLTSAVHLSS